MSYQKFVIFTLSIFLTAMWISCDSSNSETITNSDDIIVDSDNEQNTEKEQDTDIVSSSDVVIDDQCPDDPNKTEPGECGCGVPEDSCGDCTNILLSNEKLIPGEHLCSENGKYEFGLTSAGELAIWSDADTLWSAGTFGSDAHVIMQGDGNLVVYNGTSSPWSSETAGNDGATLELENDGRVVIRLGSTELWSVGGDTNVDQCPNDPNKTQPGSCGCGVPEGSCDDDDDPKSNLHVKLNGLWRGVCCVGGDLEVSDRTCDWTEGGRVLKTKDVSTGARTELRCPENGQRPKDCDCASSGERMHGIKANGNVQVANSLRLPNGAPIYPNSGHETCIDLVRGELESRYTTSSCPDWRLVGFY